MAIRSLYQAIPSLIAMCKLYKLLLEAGLGAWKRGLTVTPVAKKSCTLLGLDIDQIPKTAYQHKCMSL